MVDADGPRSAFTKRQRPPWNQPAGLAALLAGWRADEAMMRCVSLEHTAPAAEGSYASFPSALASSVREALERRGVARLYSHQAAAFEHASAGRHVVVATPTASGKSLCFNLPVLDAFARQPEARALYLFPTKALSRDQEVSLRALLTESGLQHGAVTYDGDTPGDARRAARERGGILITNPDMLHAGILPHHASWARLFANLRYVVIDELHAYRGVFGSHLANVLRRLLRIARFHGSSPTFVFASATIGNPREHAERMLGAPVELVDESGAPTGPRHVLVYNPPVVNSELGIRASYIKTAVRLTAELVRAGVPTLVFGQSRNTVEVMLKYLRDRLADEGVDPEALHAYRGGYLPETRRAIEAGLREGRIRCVVATSALELGIDIGSLDAVVCAGFPGSIAGLWQRFGRGGRRGADALALLVTSSAPLDQYFALDPQALVRGGVEHARIDADNIEILVSHLKCAAFELPFEEGEPFGDVPPEAVRDALGFLTEHRVVHPVRAASGKTVFHWAADTYPANSISLRSASWDNFVIIELGSDRTIAEMDWRSVHTMLHEQAIYQHLGEQYQVEKLDYENHKAFVRKVAPDYYTDAMTHTRIAVMQEDASSQLGGDGVARVEVGLGEVSVVEKVVGYKKIKFHTHENVGYGDVSLPEMQMHTTSCWFTLPNAALQGIGAPRPAIIDALRALAKAMHTVACVGLMIDPRDLGRAVGDRGSPSGAAQSGLGVREEYDPTIFLFDHVAGGIGLAPRLYEEREELLRRARLVIQGCSCTDGCPSCVGPALGDAAVGEQAGRGRKALSLDVLAALHVQDH